MGYNVTRTKGLEKKNLDIQIIETSILKFYINNKNECQNNTVSIYNKWLKNNKPILNNQEEWVNKWAFNFIKSLSSLELNNKLLFEIYRIEDKGEL